MKHRHNIHLLPTQHLDLRGRDQDRADYALTDLVTHILFEHIGNGDDTHDHRTYNGHPQHPTRSDGRTNALYVTTEEIITAPIGARTAVALANTAQLVAVLLDLADKWEADDPYGDPAACAYELRRTLGYTEEEASDG